MIGSVRYLLDVNVLSERARPRPNPERARLAAIGRTPPFVDGQLAAIAQTNGLVLVTANGADFRAFEGLRVEDWRT